MIISLIAAIGKNNELGKGNDLVFRLPADMKHFRDTTRGHTVIMGRKTFESLPNGPLPNRRNIVITRDANYSADGIEVVHSLDEALKIASLEQGKHFEENQEEVEIFVIGGGQIYAQAIEKANRLYITHVDADMAADTFFPEISAETWEKISNESHSADSENPYDYTFTIWKRK